jgi:L-seryl-tRNA(Ser) seleniumtransferase
MAAAYPGAKQLETAAMSLRDLPSVESLLQSETGRKTAGEFGRSLTLQAIQEQLQTARKSIRAGDSTPSSEEILARVRSTLEQWLSVSLVPVINATGVILHTNLGRAPLCESAQAAMREVSRGYSTLEYNLARGARGKREVHAGGILQRLTGAEAALVVNNNAAAVLLALTALARRKEVLVSRSQLIEIGGGFRIPDVMRQSGAKLIEVGTTNRTHPADFESAINKRTALILRAHHSNFKIVGFTTEPPLEELVRLGEKHSVPVLDDLGSGALLDTAQFGLGHEPTVQESLQAGAPLVAFSGDKLLGGPQAGIIVGEGALVERLLKHPLARALRPDKLCLAALCATLQHYLREEAVSAIPVWRMISTGEETLQKRAQRWAAQIGRGDVVASRSTVGGGSLPEETLPTWVLAIERRHPNAFIKQLRSAEPAVIARIEENRVVLDPRTVLEAQDEALIRVLKQALQRRSGQK